MQFSHIWAETGEHKKLLGRPCWRNQTYRVMVWKLRTENKGEARGLAEMEQAASSSLSSGKQETEAGKKAQQGDTKPLDSRKKPFQTPKRKALPLEKGNMAVQAGNGEGTCFYRTHYVASGLRVPRTAFPTVAVPRAPASSGGHPILLPISPDQKRGLHGHLNRGARCLSF